MVIIAPLNKGPWKGWYAADLTIDHPAYYWKKFGKYTIKVDSGYFYILDEKGIYQHNCKAFGTLKEALDAIGEKK